MRRRAPWAISPATLAADAGSHSTPSFAARNRYASRICSSVTALTAPPEEVIASIASSQRAGLPIRIALATVSGCSTGAPWTSGAAPAAWKPNIIATPREPGQFFEPRQYAVMLPALPTGMQSASSSPAERFDELERAGLLSLDPEVVDRVDQRDRVAVGELADELQRLVEVAAQRDTRAPCISAWASLPVAILPSGTITAQRSPARAA